MIYKKTITNFITRLSQLVELETTKSDFTKANKLPQKYLNFLFFEIILYLMIFLNYNHLLIKIIVNFHQKLGLMEKSGWLKSLNFAI